MDPVTVDFEGMEKGPSKGWRNLRGWVVGQSKRDREVAI